MQEAKFELWLEDERGVLSKVRDRGDHLGWAKRGSVRGWARIERQHVILFRTDKSDLIPRSVLWYYASRFPQKQVLDRKTMRGGTQ